MSVSFSVKPAKMSQVHNVGGLKQVKLVHILNMRWLHADVHMHVTCKDQDRCFDPAVNSAALAIHRYRLPNAFPVVSLNARRRETPRNAQSQWGEQYA